MDKSMEDISMSWEPVLVNVKETLHVLFPAPPTLALGENTEAGMEPEARRSLPEVLLLKSSELIDRGGGSEPYIGCRVHRDGIQGSAGPVKSSGTQHRSLGNCCSKSQGGNDYQ